jgi:hypothetical protein
MEVGEPEAHFAVERQIGEPGRQLREYRFRYDRKRRALVRDAAGTLTARIAGLVHEIVREARGAQNVITMVERTSTSRLENLRDLVAQTDRLLGSSIPRPGRWSELHAQLERGSTEDLNGLADFTWPEIAAELTGSLYADDEPLPVNVEDLGQVVSTSPSGPVATALAWDRLSPEDFERLVFALIGTETAYRNPEWLMATNAPDRGRDLSVLRITEDALTGTRHERVVIQCKHTPRRNVSRRDVTEYRDAVSLWEPPRVHELIIATSGRFSADAVDLVERNNTSNAAMRITMWPESHLERLLAGRPRLVAEFSLR